MPAQAEVHYMPDTLEDTVHFFAQIPSAHLKWAFTINHAHYDPIGIGGFIDGMDMSRCEEVRIADNNGLYELHMHPGTGTVDFVDMFRRIEATGFKGTMTLVGCGLIWVILILLILSRWFPTLGWVILPVLLFFLGLQVLRWLVPVAEEQNESKPST